MIWDAVRKGLNSMKIIWLLAIVIISFLLYKIRKWFREIPVRQAGKTGELVAQEIIREVLRENDILLSNICISYEGKETELDNVVITDKGVFIIEVKNYSGKLVGKEDDFEWKKYKLSAGGNVYEKNVKNPIKQVKRQVYILSHYLKSHGIDIWVEGYALLLENNSPVHGDCVLESRKEIGTVIHRQGRNHLSKRTMEEVRVLLKR